MLKYPCDDFLSTIKCDSALDVCHQLIHTPIGKERNPLIKSLSEKLGGSLYFGGNDIDIVDISAWSALKQTTQKQGLSQNLKNWYQKMDQILF